MSYRYMRVMVFFDLPVLTSKQRRAYRQFRNYLITSGFLMMQESVYCKLVLNSTALTSVIENLNRNKPEEGLIQVLTITEKQFSKIEYIVGNKTSEVLDTDERLVIL